MKFPLDIYPKRFIACVIICLCDKWLPQQLVLAALDLDNKMRMKVNVLDYTTGRVLLMEGKDRL